MAEPQEYTFPEGHPLRDDSQAAQEGSPDVRLNPNLPTVVGHTDEARALVAAGDATPGDKILDVPVSSMTDRELAEETVILLRNQRDAVNGLLMGINESPFGAMLTGGKMSGPLGMLFGNGSAG